MAVLLIGWWVLLMGVRSLVMTYNAYEFPLDMRLRSFISVSVPLVIGGLLIIALSGGVL